MHDREKAICANQIRGSAVKNYSNLSVTAEKRPPTFCSASLMGALVSAMFSIGQFLSSMEVHYRMVFVLICTTFFFGRNRTFVMLW